MPVRSNYLTVKTLLKPLYPNAWRKPYETRVSLTKHLNGRWSWALIVFRREGDMFASFRLINDETVRSKLTALRRANEVKRLIEVTHL